MHACLCVCACICVCVCVCVCVRSVDQLTVAWFLSIIPAPLPQTSRALSFQTLYLVFLGLFPFIFLPRLLIKFDHFRAYD